MVIGQLPIPLSADSTG